MKEFYDTIFPMNRSLTGDGVRDTLKVLQEIADFEIKEVPSGTRVFDWEVPKEWNVSEAYIEFEDKRIVDFADNNLHLVSYSAPVDGVFTLGELNKHLYSIHEIPNAIPYRTSYYEKGWGFCITDNQRKRLKEGKYHVVIKSEFKDGSMTYGEKLLKGESDEEYIINTYSCHPSMNNDNTSGMLLWAYLLQKMSKMKLKKSYRFIIAPETIGILAYLKENDTSNVKGAVVITHVTGDGLWGWKRTFKGNDRLDVLAENVISENFSNYSISSFDIRGSNERQLSSPGFRIPTIIIYKGGLYNDDYHTSLDSEYNDYALKTSLNLYYTLLKYLDIDKPIYRKNIAGEPMLGKHGLYPQLGGGAPVDRVDVDALLWVCFYSDGTYLSDIPQRAKIPMVRIVEAYKKLKKEGIVK